MQTESMRTLYDLFSIHVTENSKKYGMGWVYVKGQLKEARHQLKLKDAKLQRNSYDKF